MLETLEIGSCYRMINPRHMSIYKEKEVSNDYVVLECESVILVIDKGFYAGEYYRYYEIVSNERKYFVILNNKYADLENYFEFVC